MNSRSSENKIDLEHHSVAKRKKNQYQNQPQTHQKKQPKEEKNGLQISLR